MGQLLSRSTMTLKRLLDVFIASCAIFILWPIAIAVALLINLNLGRPIIYSQERPGLNGAPFKIYKFRTMRSLFDSNGNPLPDSERMTKFGKTLRSISLDELPNLWAILKGDMSVVGPRPLLMEYLPLYNEEQSKRHCVKPGLTGWAQVNGRNAISWDEKFRLDVWYVKNQSVLLDLRIIFLTFKKVLRPKGINANGEATMSKFSGNKK